MTDRHARRLLKTANLLLRAASLSNAQLQRSVVYHVGAHHGEEDAMYELLRMTPVYIEASPAAFRILVKKLPGRRCVHAAAVEHDGGEINLHLVEPDVSNSVLRATNLARREYPKAHWDAGSVKVPCRTVDSIVAETGCTPQVLVVDVQGAELRVLRGARRTLDSVSIVQTEVFTAPLYRGAARRADVRAFMKERGFRACAFQAGSRPTWGDEFYARRRI